MQLPHHIYKKRLGKTQYFYSHVSRVVAEIKGPYRPGSVWKLEVYYVTDEFLGAWCDDLLTPVQRGKCTPEADRVFAALAMGQSNSIDPELLTGPSKCLGYQHRTKKAATEAFITYYQENHNV